MKLTLPLVLGLVLSVISAAYGDVGIQFGLTTSPTQPGYSFFPVASSGTGSLTQTFSSLDVNVAPTGTLTVTWVGGPTSTDNTQAYGARDRGGPKNGGDLTDGPLYESYLGSGIATGIYGWLSLSGLKPNATYLMTFYAYDNSYNGTMTFTDYTFYTPTNNLVGNNTAITYTGNYNFASDPTANTQFSSSLVITSDPNGHAVIQDTGINNGNPTAVINALLISPMETSVQFKTTTGPTQAGFNPLSFSADGLPITGTITVDPSVAPSGTITLTMIGGTSPTHSTESSVTRTRSGPANSGAFTYGALYQSWSGFNLKSGEKTYITLSNLAPNSPYLVTLYSFDYNNTGIGTVVLTDVTAQTSNSTYASTYPTGDVGTFTWTGTTVTSNSQYGATLSVISDNTGRVCISDICTQGASLGGTLNGLTVVSNIHSRFSMADTVTTGSITNMQTRFSIYKSIGIGSLRTGTGWSGFETGNGVYVNPSDTYLQQAALAGMVLDFTVDAYNRAPSWYLTSHTNCYLLDEVGDTSSPILSNFYLFNNPTEEANIGTQIDYMLNWMAAQTDINQNFNFLILDGGYYGEQHYPNAAASGGNNHYWMYGPVAQTHFQNAVQVPPSSYTSRQWYYAAGNTLTSPWTTAQPYYASISAANAAWGTNFSSWTDIALPLEGSTTVTSVSGHVYTYNQQFWIDILTWYRNTMRDWIDREIQYTQTSIANHPFVSANGTTTRVPKLVVFIAGTHVSYPPVANSTWAAAIANPATPPALATTMLDSEFLIQEAHRYGLILHYTGEEATGETQYLSNYIYTTTGYDIPMWGENGGGSGSLTPVLDANNIINGKQFGFEYINSSYFLNSDNLTINTSATNNDPGESGLDLFQDLQLSFVNLSQYYNNN